MGIQVRFLGRKLGEDGNRLLFFIILVLVRCPPLGKVYIEGVTLRGLLK